MFDRSLWNALMLIGLALLSQAATPHPEGSIPLL